MKHIKALLLCIWLVFHHFHVTYCQLDVHGSIECGQNKTGDIISTSDANAYSFTVPGVSALPVKFSLCNSPDTGFDTELYLYDNSEIQIDDRCDNYLSYSGSGTCSECANGNSQEVWMLNLSPGDYYIEAHGWNTETGQYRLDMICDFLLTTATPTTSNPTSSPITATPTSSPTTSAPSTSPTTSEPTSSPSKHPTSVTSSPTPPTLPPHIKDSISCGTNKTDNIISASDAHKYAFTVPGPSTLPVTFSLCNSPDAGFDTEVKLYDNSEIQIDDRCDNSLSYSGSGTCSACANGNKQEVWMINLSPGDYYIEANGWNDRTGQYRLDMICDFYLTTASPTEPTTFPTTATPTTAIPTSSPTTAAPTVAERYIWYQDGTILNDQNWTKPSGFLSQSLTHHDAIGCPDYIGDQPCWSLCAQNTNPSSAYIYRIASTIGYENIKFGLDVDLDGMVTDPGACTIYYNIAGSDHSWTQIVQYVDLDHEIGDEFMLPSSTWNASAVGIKIYATAINPSGCCRFSRAHLSGTLINTAPVTATPTSIPTTATPTTKDPTNVPTDIPTSNEPTTSEPTTWDPTTFSPTTSEPTTSIPTTSKPTTSQPTTSNPTTTNNPTTANPTTATTFEPTTSTPTTSLPTTSLPTTSLPTTAIPTTFEPTTWSPTTSTPTNQQCTTFLTDDMDSNPGNWVKISGMDVEIETSGSPRCADSNPCWRTRDDSYYKRSISTAGYQNVSLSFNYYEMNSETYEYCRIKYSFDDDANTNVLFEDNAQNSDKFGWNTIQLPSIMDDEPNVTLYIESTANGGTSGDEYCFFDNIRFCGFTVPPTTANPTTSNPTTAIPTSSKPTNHPTSSISELEGDIKGSISCGQSKSDGISTAYDGDAYSFTVPGPLALEITFSLCNSNSAWDSELRLYNANQIEIGGDNCDGHTNNAIGSCTYCKGVDRPSMETWILTLNPGSYYIEASGYSSNVGPYTLDMTCNAVTSQPTMIPTTYKPTTNEPTTFNPTTSNPTTANPTTNKPSMNPSITPTTSEPTDNPSFNPTTYKPTINPSVSPTTAKPTYVPSFNPTTSQPTTASVVSNVTIYVNLAKNASVEDILNAINSTTNTYLNTLFANDDYTLTVDVIGKEGDKLKVNIIVTSKKGDVIVNNDDLIAENENNLIKTYGEGVVDEDDEEQTTAQPINAEGNEKKDNAYIWYIVGGVCVLIIIGLILFYVKRKRENKKGRVMVAPLSPGSPSSDIVEMTQNSNKIMRVTSHSGGHASNDDFKLDVDISQPGTTNSSSYINGEDDGSGGIAGTDLYSDGTNDTGETDSDEAEVLYDDDKHVTTKGMIDDEDILPNNRRSTVGTPIATPIGMENVGIIKKRVTILDEGNYYIDNSDNDDSDDNRMYDKHNKAAKTKGGDNDSDDDKMYDKNNKSLKTKNGGYKQKNDDDTNDSDDDKMYNKNDNISKGGDV